MDKYFNYITIVGGIIGGVLANLLGGWDTMLLTLLIICILDYITGWMDGYMNKELSSKAGFKGIFKKVMMFAIVALAYWIQSMIYDAIPLRESVIMFYVLNEALSVLENVSSYIPIPAVLKNALLQLKKKEESEEPTQTEAIEREE